MHHRPEFCPGCNTQLGINFCPKCGQEAVLHPPSMGEFVAEFIGHYVAVEGKLWRSLGLLIARPGALTRAYMAGKRVAYIQPLRLFLTLSVILFAILQFGGFSIGNGEHGNTEPDQLALRGDVRDVPSVQPAPAAGKRYALSLGYYSLNLTTTADGETVGFSLLLPDADDTSLLMSTVRKAFPSFDDRVRHFSSLAPEEKAERMTHGFFARMPYVIFGLVPVFALMLKLLYFRSRRAYGEYLLFALHVNAFAFFIMILMHWAPLPWGAAVLAAWLLFYLARAMQNVYGGPVAMTLLRWQALMLGYLAALVVVITQVMLMMALTR